MKSRLILLSAFLLICGGSAFAQTKPVNALDGRWYLSFNLPDGVYQSAVSFQVGNDGAVKTSVLSEPNIYLSDGTFDGKQLKLNGKSAYGNVVIAADFTDDKISGKWFLGLVSGSMSGEREPSDKPKTDYIKVFEKTWKTINDKFYDPNFNGVDWQSVREKYRPQVEKITGDAEFINTMRQLMKELKVSHVSFYYSPFADAVAVKNVESFKPLVWKKIAPDVGYLQIKEFTESPEAVAAVDKAFAEIGDAPNLIIDLRGNTGGTLSVAMRLGDYLFDKPTPTGFFSSREGLKRYKVNSMDALKVEKLAIYSEYTLKEFWSAIDKNGAVAVVSGGRAPKVYRGKIVILINERCASTTEGFVAVIKEKKLATIIGSKTRGMILSAVSEKTPEGWMLKFPKADYRTPQGKRIEGVGVEPDIAAEKNKELEIALQMFGKSN